MHFLQIHSAQKKKPHKTISYAVLLLRIMTKLDKHQSGAAFNSVIWNYSVPNKRQINT